MIIHKRNYDGIDQSTKENFYKYKCDFKRKNFKEEKASYYWKNVTCKKCLKLRK